MYKYLDTVEFSDDYAMIMGRHLNFQKHEADVANSIIFKRNKVLYIIDSGALMDFRKVLLNKCLSLLPFNKAILLNTHGHCDHVANNIILEDINVPEKAHYISVHDLGMMRNNRDYFLESFKKIVPFIADGLSSEERIDRLLKLFHPIEVETNHLMTLETLPTEDIAIGNVHWSGWKFDESLYVLRSEGHTRGHVITYFPQISHIHMGDEINGYCNLFHDCDNLKSLETHTKVLSMLNEGTVSSMTSSHEFVLFDKEQAKEKLQSLIEAHYIYEDVLRNLLLAHPAGLLFADIKKHLNNSTSVQQLTKTANPNPAFNTLMLLSKFRDLGIIPDTNDPATALFQFQGKIKPCSH